jgi:hypothetical protein
MTGKRIQRELCPRLMEELMNASTHANDCDANHRE